MVETIVLGVLLCAAVGTATASWLLTRRDFARRFAHRLSMNVQDIVAEFPAESAVFLSTLIPRLEKTLEIPTGKLRLDDRFDRELLPNPKFAIYHPEADILEDLQEMFPREPILVPAVRDYCEYALRLLAEASDPQRLLDTLL